MSVTKMKAVTIAGQISKFDEIVGKYVYDRDIHLENAISVLTNRGMLHSFEDNDKYDQIIKDAEAVIKLSGRSIKKNVVANESMTLEEMRNAINEMNTEIESEKTITEQLTGLINSNNEAIARFEKMAGLNVNITKLRRFEFIRAAFGKMPKTSFVMLETYLNKLDAFFIKTAEDATDVWGFYFTPAIMAHTTEEILNSLYFERIEFSPQYEGTPEEIKNTLIQRNTSINVQLDANKKKMTRLLADSTDKISGIYNLAKKRSMYAEIRRNAAHGDMFFYVVGWMSAKDAKKLEKEMEASDDAVMCYMDDPETVPNMQPPTKLKNNPIFKPFEMFVKMYGLPSYNEIDPTPILAMTYILFFGIMFGDVGQSAVLAIVGFLIYKIKKIDLAGIVGWVGLSGIVFGFIYGSFFGNEEIIPKLFNTTPIRPMEQAIFMLGATIAMGVVIIIFGIILNIINSLKAKNTGAALFGHNGIAGLIFYVSVLLLAANMYLKWGVPSVIFAIAIIVTLLVMYMAEPLANLLAGKKDWLPGGKMYFVENLFEMFEVVLSFFTNTISFLRIGAFAIVHVGMMMVVSILTPAGMSVGSILVMVIGNAVVMVLEGLIVGIQVLRLEYYEMFSRYFTGRGKEFISLRDR